MRRAVWLVAPAALLLSGCINGGFGGDSVHEQTHRTLSAAGIHSLRVENVSGPVTIRAGDNGNVIVNATKSAGDTDSLRNTQVEIRQDGSELIARTNNIGSGNWFSRNNHASVAYSIRAPAGVSLEVSNISGPVTIAGMRSNVRVNEVSGPVRASLGQITSARNITMDSVSGSISVGIAGNSDVRVEARTVSGAIKAFFPADLHKGFVGGSLDGRLGSGDGSMTLAAVSGSITVTRE